MFLTQLTSNGVNDWTRGYGGNGGGEQATPFAQRTDTYTRLETLLPVHLMAMPTMDFQDMYIMKFSYTGSKVWSSTWGRTSGDRPEGIALDDFSNIYIGGSTESSPIDAYQNGWSNGRVSDEVQQHWPTLTLVWF